MKLLLGLIILFSFSLAHADEMDHERNHDVTFTPSLSILDFPHPLDLGLEVTLYDVFGIKVAKSLEPVFNINGDQARVNDVNIQAKVYPFMGSWFLGLAYGQHELDAHHHQNINGYDTDFYGDVKSQYLSPMTGWRFVSDNGFTLGVEFGWIFPFNSSASVGFSQDGNPFVTSSSDYQRNRQQAQDTANNYANQGLPNIGLLEIGWTF